MAVPEHDETSGDHWSAEDPGSEEEPVDLWSIPSTTLNLDDPAAWGDGEDVLGRLAEVLPISGQDMAPELALGQVVTPERRPGTDSVVGRARSAGVRHLRSIPKTWSEPAPREQPTRRPRARSEARVVALPGRPPGLSLREVVLLLAAAYLVTVVGALIWGPRPEGGGSTGRDQVRVVTDGPLPCPMYEIPATDTPVSVPAGSCFFVG